MREFISFHRNSSFILACCFLSHSPSLSLPASCLPRFSCCREGSLSRGRRRRRRQASSEIPAAESRGPRHRTFVDYRYRYEEGMGRRTRMEQRSRGTGDERANEQHTASQAALFHLPFLTKDCNPPRDWRERASDERRRQEAGGKGKNVVGRTRIGGVAAAAAAAGGGGTATREQREMQGSAIFCPHSSSLSLLCSCLPPFHVPSSRLVYFCFIKQLWRIL